MKPIWAVLVAVTLVASYAAGRQNRDSAETEIPSLETFRMSMVENDTLLRSIRYNAFLETLNQENLEEARELFVANYEWLSKDESRAFFLAWARFDPKGALDWALAQPLRHQVKFASGAMYAWAFYAPDVARRALRQTTKRPDAFRLTILREKHANGWTQGGNLDRISVYLSKQPESNYRQKATSMLAAELMHDSPERLIRWAESIEWNANGKFKAVAFQKAANMLAQADPVRAAHWIEDHLDKSYTRGLPGLVVKRWVEREDPAAGIQWLLGLPADRIRSNAVSTAIARWAGLDAETARIWLREATPSEALDSAVETMARQDTELSPKSAIGWAERVHDPETRRRLIINAGQSWLRTDPYSAELWLKDSELAEDIRAEIRQAPTAPNPRTRNRQQPVSDNEPKTIHGSDRVEEA